MPIELPDVVTTLRYGHDVLRPPIRAGEIARFRPGAYLSAEVADLPIWRRRRTLILGRCVAVASTFSTAFAFSHATAAMLHGWSVCTPDDRVHLMQTVNPGAGHPPDVIRHVCASLAPLDVVTIEGLPVTGVEQTILDCARSLPADEALVVADSAFGFVAQMSKFRRAESEQRQQLLRERLLARLTALGPARGVRSARQVLELADGFATFPGESRMRWVALRGGLPVPTCQLELWVDGNRYFADAAWSGRGADGPWLVIAEFDGDVKYQADQGPDVVVREKRREDGIRRRHRAEFVRLDTPQLNHPDAAFAEMIGAFRPGCVPTLQPRPLLHVLPRPPRRKPRS